MENPREILKDSSEGFVEFNKSNGEQMKVFSDLMGTLFKDGTLDVKTKELISVAIGIYNRCKYCIVGHSYKALRSGASPEEIMEAAMVAVAFGGGPSMAYSVTLLRKSLEEFKSDFNK
ncbi:carboxymuconolactone decarboxylase family protein [Clostridium sp. Mt-5]|uniref:Carboxymuconolactone decarboxylase family protein n=1 Tax=Clostridium moutaii TaxID=3240932 RepID=A0ABV4BMM7_9CLOT